MAVFASCQDNSMVFTRGMKLMPSPITSLPTNVGLIAAMHQFGARMRGERDTSAGFARDIRSATDRNLPISITGVVPAQTKNLTPAVVTLVAPSGTITLGDLEVPLDPAVVVITAPDGFPVIGAQFIDIDPAVVIITAPTGEVTQTRYLTPAVITLVAPTAFVDVETMIPLDPGIITLVAPSLTVEYGPLNVDIDPAILAIAAGKPRTSNSITPKGMLKPETYFFYLNNPTYGVLAVPIQSAQASISYNGSITMSVNAPGGATIAGQIANYYAAAQIEAGATHLSLLRKRVYPNGAQIMETIASGVATNFDFNRGTTKYVFTLRSSESSPTFPGTHRNLVGVQSIAASNGVLRARVALDPEIQPLDVVTYVPSGQQFVVGSISITMNVASTWMDLSELVI